MQKDNTLLYWVKIVSLGLILGLGLQFAEAWTAPSALPPGGNVAGPVTLGAGAQYKLGRLGVNSNVAPINALEVGGGGNALIGGNAYVSGSVGIGTAAPTAYLHVQKPYDPGTPLFIATNSSNDNGFRVGGLGLTSLGNHAASDGSPAAWLNVKAESSVGKPLILGTNDGADRFRVGGAGKVEAFGASADFCLDRGSGATCLSRMSGGGGGLLGMYARTTAGSATAVPPAGATKALIMVQGGGGTATIGGGGGYAEAVKDISGNLTVTVGGRGGFSSVTNGTWTIRGDSSNTEAGGGHSGGDWGVNGGNGLSAQSDTSGSYIVFGGNSMMGVGSIASALSGARSGNGFGGGAAIYSTSAMGGAVFIYWY